MFRTLSDFTTGWSYESDATLKLLRTLTPKSLAQPISQEGRNLGRLAWHVTTAVFEMARHAGLPAEGPTDETPQPPLHDIVSTYERGSRLLPELVERHWTDAMLLETIPIYGEQWTRGQTLSALVVHQAHHRGQMTVLMRQAGLAVPGIYGPAREEWAAMGMPPQP
jgi:uncharacterized damage-inducible protein DinB